MNIDLPEDSQSDERDLLINDISKLQMLDSKLMEVQADTEDCLGDLDLPDEDKDEFKALLEATSQWLTNQVTTKYERIREIADDQY